MRFPSPTATHWPRAPLFAAILAVASTFGAETPIENDPQLAWTPFLKGDYEAALATARLGRTEHARNPDWWRIEIESLLALGRYEEAHDSVRASMDSTRRSLRIHLLGIQTARYAGDVAEAETLLTELRYVVMSRRRYLRSIGMLVDYGEAALVLGAEPKLVLENFLKPGRDAKPPIRDAFLATGALALGKHDNALASRTYQQGITAFPDDPDMWAGLAASFLDGDRNRLVEYAQQALELNPSHVRALLLLAEHAIDAQNPEAASALLDQAAAVNPRHPEMLALRAVLAHLANDLAAAERYRAAALSTWRENPGVDYLIGRKLAQRYRFRAGAEHQRRALAFDPDYGPALLELAQDLLRLGQEREGWEMAHRAHKLDAYNVAAYNLATLHDRMGEYSTLENAHFRLRMGRDEAPIYGSRALALLEKARTELTAKYGIALEEKTTIEIHPKPNDFAVRTFGMPDKPGFLGVCFGPVVTINSPATRRANWEAVVWHEFTHVITLAMTRNKMPRWLSEGISVHEEHRQNPAWRRVMSLDDRQRILEGRMQPISGMSAAFLEAESSEDLQFAYFEAGLVVDFLVQEYGFDNLRALLLDLGEGMDTNEALARHFAPLEILDKAFARYARDLATSLGEGWDLDRPNTPGATAMALFNPRHVPSRLREARKALEDEQPQRALEILQPIAEGGLYLPGEENIHMLLARAYQDIGDAEGERRTLETVVAHEADALEPVQRLLSLAAGANDPVAMDRWADAWLAINPLAATPWRARFSAAETCGHVSRAIEAGETLLLLDPPDLANIHHRLARVHRTANDLPRARRHLLTALEQAPRYRQAHQLLADLPAPAEAAQTNPGLFSEPQPPHP